MTSEADKIRKHLIDCNKCMKEHLTDECPKGYFVLNQCRNEEVIGDWEAPIIYVNETETEMLIQKLDSVIEKVDKLIEK